uniref:Uncharacterized protein n=1 Tax=Anguilla anguilla TaxID=7936 RepID=A0A0E9QEU7_ANGAN
MVGVYYELSSKKVDPNVIFVPLESKERWY